MEEPQESKDVFSINDWDIERGIFNLVIALVQQKAERLGQDAARLAVINLLESFVEGLRLEPEKVEDKIDEFLQQQRDEQL